MKKIKMILISAFLMASLPAFAECPIEMDYNDLVDCIVVEGADSTHIQDFISEDE